MTLQAFLDDGNEILVPAPDYPLWTGAVTLSGGTPVHYRCDEDNGWDPDLADIEAKITPQTQGLVIINPNNPTGAVYSEGHGQGPGRHRSAATSCGLQRRDLREDPVRRRGAPPHAAYGRRRAVPDLPAGLSKAYRCAATAPAG
jgi:alanine-synthesizing transaminase